MIAFREYIAPHVAQTTSWEKRFLDTDTFGQPQIDAQSADASLEYDPSSTRYPNGQVIIPVYITKGDGTMISIRLIKETKKHCIRPKIIYIMLSLSGELITRLIHLHNSRRRRRLGLHHELELLIFRGDDCEGLLAGCSQAHLNGRRCVLHSERVRHHCTKTSTEAKSIREQLTKVVHQFRGRERLHPLRQLGALALTQKHRNAIPHLHPSEVDAQASVSARAKSAVGSLGALGVAGASGGVVEETARVEIERAGVQGCIAVVGPCLRGDDSARGEVVTTHGCTLRWDYARQGARDGGVEAKGLVDGGVEERQCFEVSVLEAFRESAGLQLKLLAKLRTSGNVPESERHGVGSGARAGKDKTGRLDLDIDVSQSCFATSFLLGLINDSAHEVVGAALQLGLFGVLDSLHTMLEDVVGAVEHLVEFLDREAGEESPHPWVLSSNSVADESQLEDLDILGAL